MGNPQRYLRYTATTLLVLLIALTLAWELWLAPLRAGGSWLALKAFPLFLPLGGIIRGRTYTYRWAVMLMLAYLAEGTVRVYTEHGLSGAFATLEVVLAVGFFVAALAYARCCSRQHT
jgi:uncharacterized membrane protein